VTWVFHQRMVLESVFARVNCHADRGVMPKIRGFLVIIAAILASGVAAMAPAGASASVTLDGSFSTVFVKPDVVGLCPSGVADECGTMQLAGLGAADWAYAFGPTFEPDGRCFDVDGTLTITLQSDGSTVSGPLTGLFCPFCQILGISMPGPFRTATPSWRTTASRSPGGRASLPGCMAARASTRSRLAHASQGR
jgi:hypothetical protein